MTLALDNLGPHLLGRIPNDPDPRDFTVAMVKDASPLDLAFAKLEASKSVAPATKAWAAEAMKVLEPGSPTPPAPPAPPAGDFVWKLDEPVLDQGQTPHCGGFGGCQWGNVLPVDDAYRNADGDALYYEAVAIGGVPNSEGGVQSRWVAKALQARKRLSTYAFAKTLDEVRSWLAAKGPVMAATDWTNDMFNPDGSGLVKPTGGVAGGHFWVVVGDLLSKERLRCLNSWSDSWGDGGFFEIEYADFETLMKGLDYPGDAILSPELAIA